MQFLAKLQFETVCHERPCRELHILLNQVYVKSRSTENLEVFCKFKFLQFFPVIFGCSFSDSALIFGFLSKLYGFLTSKPQVFLLNGTLKSVFLKNVLGKLVHPKIHKNGPIEINGIIGAVFENFWMSRFSKVFS